MNNYVIIIIEGDQMTAYGPCASDSRYEVELSAGSISLKHHNGAEWHVELLKDWRLWMNL